MGRKIGVLKIVQVRLKIADNDQQIVELKSRRVQLVCGSDDDRAFQLISRHHLPRMSRHVLHLRRALRSLDRDEPSVFGRPSYKPPAATRRNQEQQFVSLRHRARPSGDWDRLVDLAAASDLELAERRAHLLEHSGPGGVRSCTFEKGVKLEQKRGALIMPI